MRNPNLVLDSLSAHSAQIDYKFKRIYRLLFNPCLYARANRATRIGAADRLRGLTGSAANCGHQDRVRQIIGKLRSESYQPKPLATAAQRITTSHGDQALERVLSQLLHALFFGRFVDGSSNFSVDRRPEQALQHLRQGCCAVRWFAVLDQPSIFGKNHHAILMNILQERIQDERLLRLIRKFLKAGYLDYREQRPGDNREPKRTIIGWMLLQIYFQRLDRFVQEIPGYMPEWRKQPLQDHPSVALHYLRYGDRFLLGLNGSRSEAQQIVQQVSCFLQQGLQIVMPVDALPVRPACKNIFFLSYALSIKETSQCWIQVPPGALRQHLLTSQTLEIKIHKGREQWKPRAKPEWTGLADTDIRRKYASLYYRFFRYYAIAHPAASIRKIRHILQQSMYKTFAAKYRTKVTKICQAYRKRGGLNLWDKCSKKSAYYRAGIRLRSGGSSNK